MSETGERDDGNEPIRDDPFSQIRDGAGKNEQQADEPKNTCKRKRYHILILIRALACLKAAGAVAAV